MPNLPGQRPITVRTEMAEEALRELTAERIVARMTQETALHSRLQDQLREAEDEIAAAQERQRLRRQLEDRRPCRPCPNPSPNPNPDPSPNPNPNPSPNPSPSPNPR